MESKNSHESEHIGDRCYGCWCGGYRFWGIILIIFGGYFLAQSLGWLNYSIELWPLLFIGIGGYLLYKWYRDKQRH